MFKRVPINKSQSLRTRRWFVMGAADLLLLPSIQWLVTGGRVQLILI